MLRRKGWKFVLDVSFIRMGVGLQRADVCDLKLVPPASTVPRLGNGRSQRAARPDGRSKGKEETTDVDKMV